MNKPYIGVTDFTTHEQVLDAVATIPAGVNRRLHVGVMTSLKVLKNIPTSAGWKDIWLTREQMRDVLRKDPAVFNVIHYADYDDRSDLTNLLAAVDHAGPGVDGLQLDMLWPLPSMLSQFKAIMPHIELILQVSSKAIELSPDWERDVAAYEGIVDYVLLDTGMGQGIAFDPTQTIDRISTVLKYFNQDQVAVAGGLGPETYINMKPILELWPDISCDAQARLRPSGDAKDPIDMDYVNKYILGVCSLIGVNMDVKQKLDKLTQNLSTTYLDAFWSDGSVIYDPATGVRSYRHSGYVKTQTQSAAKITAQHFEEQLRIVYNIDARTNPHQVPYGETAGSWKIETYIPAHQVESLT